MGLLCDRGPRGLRDGGCRQIREEMGLPPLPEDEESIQSSPQSRVSKGQAGLKMHAFGSMIPASAEAGHASRVPIDATASREFTPKQVASPTWRVLIKRGGI